MMLTGAAYGFTLSGGANCRIGTPGVSSGTKPGLLSSTVSSNEDLKPGIGVIDTANEEIMGHLNDLRQTQNFRLYSVDILASCEYMPQELFECYSETCEIYPVDEDEVRSSSIDDKISLGAALTCQLG